MDSSKSIITAAWMMLLMACVESVTAQPPQNAAYQSIVLSNPVAQVEVSLMHGRITSWKRHDAPEVLWSRERETRQMPAPHWKGYQNCGGDKVWPMPEKLRPFARDNFVPSPQIDGQPWQLIEHGKRHLVMQSRLDPVLGIRLTRKLTLNPMEARLTIVNKISRQIQSPFPVHIWSVSQVVRPQYFLIQLDAQAFSKTRSWYRYRADQSKASCNTFHNWLDVTLPSTDWDKLYALGHRIAAVYDWGVFVQRIEPVNQHASYSDGATLQLYGNPFYAEMETLSPLQSLQPGEQYVFEVSWELIDLKSDDVQNRPSVIERIDECNK